MEEKPRSRQEPILTRLGLSLILVISVASALGALLLFGHFFQVHNNPDEGRSVVFASFSINTMIYIFGYRSLRRPLSRMSPLGQNKPLLLAVAAGLLTAAVAFLVPPLREALGIVPLTAAEWGLVFGVAFALLVVVEVAKWISSRPMGDQPYAR